MLGRVISKGKSVVRFLRSEVGRFEEEERLRSRFPGVARGVVIRSPERFEVGARTRIEEGVYINCGGDWAEGGYFRSGEGCFIGAHSVIYAAGGVEFGHHVALSPHVLITSHQHVFRPEVTHYMEETQRRPVVVGNNVVLNMGATILSGVTIGDDAVVAAQAVVTKDVPSGCLVMGAPARIVRKINEQ